MSELAANQGLSLVEKNYPDWDEFKAKAKDSVCVQFESLSRMLFCEELGIEQGSLVAVQNQPGNEVQVVSHQGELIGFQSKFFKNRFNVQEFKNSIIKARKYNPAQSVIYLYSNLSPSCRQLENLHKILAEQGMKGMLRFGSQILDRVASSPNNCIFEVFFHLHSESEMLIKSGIEKTKSYLKDILTAIQFKDSSIVIERQMELCKLKDILSNGNVAVIIGQGGCGKSGLVKMLLEQLGDDVDAVRIIRGERLNCQSISEMLGTNDQLFFEAYESFNNKVFVVDSAEQILPRNFGAELTFLFRQLKKYKWKTIFTCRIDESNTLLNYIHDKLDTGVGIVNVDAITEKDILSLSSQYGFELPHDRNLRDYICIPMNLNTYLSGNNRDKQISFSEYKQLEWNEKKCGSIKGVNSINREVEKTVLRLAKALYLDTESSVELSEIDSISLEALCKNHVLYYDKDSGNYRFSHDLYGEWAVTEMLEKDYKESNSIAYIYQEYKNSVTGRRCFRQWIGDNLLEDNEIYKEILNILKIGESGLKNETMTAILQSDNVRSFFLSNQTILLENDMEVLKEFLFWLPVSCVYISKNDLDKLSSVNLVPNGECWEIIIDIIYDLGIDLWYALYYKILPVLLVWSKANEKGETTQKCGKIAVALLNQQLDNDKRLLFYKIIPVLFRCSSEIVRDIEIYLREILAKGKIEDSSIERRLLEYVIKEIDIGNYRLSKCSPQLVMDIWDYCWHDSHIDDEGFAFGNYATYGLDRSFSIVMGDGWIGTSMAYSLLANRRFAEEYLPIFLNQCVDTAIRKLGDYNSWREIEFKLQGKQILQWGDEELWCAYRNRVTYNVPELIVALLMALQWYLDWLINHKSIDSSYLNAIIERSNNVMITAVVTSVALKHLDVCRQLVDELAESEDLAKLDWHRWATEYDSYDVNCSSSVNMRTSFLEREKILKKNVHLCQCISLTNYKETNRSLPSLPVETILNSASMAPVKWTMQVFEGKSVNREQSEIYLKEAKHSYEKYYKMGFVPGLSLSYVDGVAPAFIKLCEDIDENAVWCKDVIIAILRESDHLYRPDVIYDGVGYCLNVVPKLLILFPKQRKDILGSVLMLVLNIKDRANMRPLDECLVEMIREGGLWSLYQDEMTEFIAQYIKLCRERSGRLLPKELSLALRMLPLQDNGLKMQWMRINLVKDLFKCDENDLNRGLLNVRHLSEPIGEILIYSEPSLTGRLSLFLLKRKLTRKRIAEAYLWGLLHVAASSSEFTIFFSIWKNLAQSVFGCRRRRDYDIIRLKRVLTFQDNEDVLSKMTEQDEFCVKSYDFMCFLVSNFPVDAEIVKGIIVMMGYVQTEKLSVWVRLLSQSLNNTSASVINYVGLLWMEDLIKDCLNILGNDLERNRDLKMQMLVILDKMILCGSSRAYAMKEYL